MYLALSDQIAHTAAGSALPSPGVSRLLSALTGLIGEAHARCIIHRIGTERLRSVSAGELVSVCDFPPTLAARIVAARDVGAALALRRPAARSAEAVLGTIPSGLEHLETEVLLGIALTNSLRVKSVLLLSKGGSMGLSVMPRDILTATVRASASAFVLVHNHPSGDPTPSTEDLYFTRSVARIAAVLGIDLVDHLIVAESGIVSLLEEGHLSDLIDHPVETMAAE